MSLAVFRRLLALAAIAAGLLCIPTTAAAHPAAGIKSPYGKRAAKRCAHAAKGRAHKRRAIRRCLERVAAKRDRTKPVVAIMSPTSG